MTGRAAMAASQAPAADRLLCRFLLSVQTFTIVAQGGTLHIHLISNPERVGLPA